VAATPARIRVLACSHAKVAVVSSYPAGLDVTALARDSHTTLGRTELWYQGSGAPLFQIAWFTRGTSC
jgi:hypothetical protein